MMRKRLLGKTGEELSVVGFGGIAVMDETPAEASRLVAQAVERGINYFDVAPSYGNAEEMLGPALQPYRSEVFLACKTLERTAERALRELDESLARTRSDYFDLYQLHAVSTLEEVEEITRAGGALEGVVQAREQGLVRFLGFSSHAEEGALALMDRFPFDTILFPFNWVSWHQSDFGRRVLESAQERGLGILALKSLARRKLREGEERPRAKCWYYPAESFDEASLALRFTLSRPITAAVSPGHEELLWWACDAADELEPLTEAEEAEAARRSTAFEPIFPLD
jgi:aryl-alcohol dehydrogenase-like predicted oxidoreductase